MLPLLTRIIKRFAVLLVGAFFVYLAVWKVFPFFDKRTPAALALFVTYVAMAYIVIPFGFRIFRLFYRPTHLPLYCTTPDGFASDPINIGLIGTREQVVEAMTAAGWELADDNTLAAWIRQVLATLTHTPYVNAPMSRLYLFGRKQDLGFEVEISSSLGKRHHVRFWAAELELTEGDTHHVHFWQHFYRPSRHTPSARLWVGAASKDVGFAPIRHNAQLTHMIDPDTNAERKKILHDLRTAGRLTSHRFATVGKPLQLRNRAWRGQLRTDGRIAICELR
ncbi:MAG TPA: LssY C-terminal domain-containing protein [Candidatus Saccharimonadales bacterium]|nr:LssY C-terminal domain-containing protein [Candidatus Saccharimonadales bacterium]